MEATGLNWLSFWSRAAGTLILKAGISQNLRQRQGRSGGSNHGSNGCEAERKVISPVVEEQACIKTTTEKQKQIMLAPQYLVGKGLRRAVLVVQATGKVEQGAA